MAWSHAQKHFDTGSKLGGEVEHVYFCAVIQADRHFPLSSGRAAGALPGLKKPPFERNSLVFTSALPLRI
jgi:hypothetical protein